jgi:hypothetical protein
MFFITHNDSSLMEKIKDGLEAFPRCCPLHTHAIFDLFNISYRQKMLWPGSFRLLLAGGAGCR